MYAIIQTGGKQYKVEKGTKIQVERLPNEAGSEAAFSEVLLLGGDGSAKIGTPTVPGASVTAKIVRHLRGPKLIVFKRRPKKGYRKKAGHRQELTEIEVQSIQG
jgi:large subunit ribosomal protein L21